MRRSLRSRSVAAILAGATAFAALPATAGNAARRVTPPLPVGGFTSPNIEWLDNVSIPGELTYTHVSYKIGNYLYYDGLQRFSILDLSRPTKPQLVSQIERPGPGPWPSDVGYYHDFGRSVTNGEILIIPGGHRDYFTAVPRALYIFDITDKANPKKIGEMVVDETLQGLFCVLDCTWLYDRTGHVIDLRDPTKPKLTYANWQDGLSINNWPLSGGGTEAAEIFEAAPGILLTGSVPMHLLDARKNPRRPRVLAKSDGTPLSFGDVAWPRFGERNIVLSSDPNTHFPICDRFGVTEGTALDHGFATWDASRWKKLGIITPIDDYKPVNGTYIDGDPPTSADHLGGACAINRFHVHPSFDGGGLVAAGAFSHGFKLLRIGGRGQINVAGWFLPYGHAITGDAVFASNRVVYAIDFYRGIDILRYEGKL